MKKILNIVFVLTLINSCATINNITYIEPTRQDYSKSKNFNHSGDKVWSALIDYATESFFSINTYEKDSGLMTLSFSSSPEKYVNCGKWVVDGTTNNYVQFMRMRPGTSVNLNGIMNIRVSESDGGNTTLTVNARYILTLSQSSGTYVGYTDTYSFDSKSTETVYISNPSAGTTPTRTCGPTGLAETTILEGVASLL